MLKHIGRRSLLASSAALVIVLAISGRAAAEDVAISFLSTNQPNSVAVAEEFKAQFEAANPNIKIEIEYRPGGGDGDNIIKTRLATGEMSDVFTYNSGSLFQAMNPGDTLVDMSSEPWQANVLDSYKSVVTANDGTVRGGPLGAAMGGGILYNIPIYKELGLSIPKSWDEFMANNEKIKAAGKDPVIQTFGTTWTSQLFVLGDFFNVLAEVPDFATEYTANRAKYATTPAAMKGFVRQEDIYKSNYLNEDFQAATFEEGVMKVATGEGAHYPMLTFAVSTIQQIAPEHIGDVGFFAIPGDSTASNGLTTWMPDGVYIPKTTTGAKLEAAKKFVAFIESTDGCAAYVKAAGATGPFLVKGCALPTDVPPVVADLLPYFQQDGTSAPALEFLSPIKGPALEQITVEVGSGIRSAADAAALYDEDVKKQAQQLGIAGW
ncbi:ABC transporter substrate-binding protein [Roseovarius sp.]|uniref:ABC transporter substrate-binding protein n=1 Tax=Roseovarius sp. TaxID=1486281 RepID=UPI003A96AF18